MKIFHQVLQLKRKRGCHLITDEVIDAIPGLPQLNAGICNVFIQHTSASLTINENASANVRRDLEKWLNKIAPENDNYHHDDEGPDDMPAHIKSAILSTSVSIPIQNGKLALGTWQGIYLCEHRDWGGERNLLITVIGE